VNAATASFNDITGQMTEMSQRRKKLRHEMRVMLSRSRKLAG